MTAQRGISTLTGLDANSRNMVQGTAAQRPVLSRSDNLENVALYTDLLNSWPTKSGATTPDDLTILEGAGGTYHYVAQTFAAVAGQTYVFEGSFKRGVGDRDIGLEIAWPNSGGASNVYLNLTNNTNEGTTGTTNAWISGPTLTADGDYIRVSGTATASATGVNGQIGLFMVSSGTTTSYSGDGTSTVLAKKIVARSAYADSTYLATTDFPWVS